MWKPYFNFNKRISISDDINLRKCLCFQVLLQEKQNLSNPQNVSNHKFSISFKLFTINWDTKQPTVPIPKS